MCLAVLAVQCFPPCWVPTTPVALLARVLRTSRANTCGHRRVLSGFFGPALLLRPRLVFEQAARQANLMDPPATWSPRFSETMHSDVTSLQLSCFICGKMLAALPKNLRKILVEKSDEKPVRSVLQPTARCFLRTVVIGCSL